MGGCIRKVGGCDLWRILRRTFRAQIRSAVGPCGLLDTDGDPSRDWDCNLPAAVSGFSEGTQGLKMVLPVHSPQTCICALCFFLETFLLTFL